MDVLAHTLWANVMYKFLPQAKVDRQTTVWGVIFGVLPDLVSFTPVFAYFFYKWIFDRGPFLSGDPSQFETNGFYEFAAQSYNVTHSLVIWAAATLLIWAIYKKFPWFLLGWALHVFIDIFTHTEQYFPTPFLYPIFDYKISVISWGTPMFMAINYAAILIFYFAVLPRMKKKAKENAAGLQKN